MNQTCNNNQCALSALVPGESARVVHMRLVPTALRQRLVAMGLTHGTTITLVRRAPMGDPLQFRLRDSHLCLRADEITPIVVEKLP